MNKILEYMQPGKIYTKGELLKASKLPSSTASYIFSDLEVSGKIEFVRMIGSNYGYRIKQ